jgi:hypothetical protein
VADKRTVGVSAPLDGIEMESSGSLTRTVRVHSPAVYLATQLWCTSYPIVHFTAPSGRSVTELTGSVTGSSGSRDRPFHPT